MTFVASAGPSKSTMTDTESSHFVRTATIVYLIVLVQGLYGMNLLSIILRRRRLQSQPLHLKTDHVKFRVSMINGNSARFLWPGLIWRKTRIKSNTFHFHLRKKSNQLNGYFRFFWKVAVEEKKREEAASAKQKLLSSK